MMKFALFFSAFCVQEIVAQNLTCLLQSSCQRTPAQKLQPCPDPTLLNNPIPEPFAPAPLTTK